MADQLIDPVPIFKKTIKFTKKYPNVQILWASTRETYNFAEAKKIGCHIITMPPKLIDQIKGIKKTQKQLTHETVKGFYLDAIKSKFKM